MSAHATHGHDDDHGHSHPTPRTYLGVGVILFALTALEVLAYEVGHRPTWPLHALVEPMVVPILLILSAFKFVLVAGFYMHLKQDSKIFTNLFVWPIVLAVALAMALVILFNYWVKETF